MAYTQLLSLKGPAGNAGSPGPGILSGQGAPAPSVGVSGSFYQDLTNAFQYGPKPTDTSWSGATIINLIGPSGTPGAAGAAATIPNDLAANSLAIAPVSGDSTASAITQKNGAGTTVFSTDTSGGVQSSGAMSVAGAATFGNTLGVTGAASLAAVTASGNASIGGTLNVTGATTAAAVTASGLVTAANVTLSSGGKVTFADGTSQSTAPGTGITYNRCEVYAGNIVSVAAGANGGNDLRPPGTTAVSYQYRFPRAGVIYGFTLTGTISAAGSIGSFVNRTPAGTSSGSDIITLSGSFQTVTTAGFGANGVQYVAATPIVCAQGDTIIMKPGMSVASTLSLVGFLNIGLTPQTT